MYPFTKTTDYLQLESHRTYENEGLNYINVREEWYNTVDITTEDTFTSINTGLIVSGSWLTDSGDPSAELSIREKRFYCRKGKASMDFNGTSILLRLYMNPLYGKADIRIDGVKPSDIGGVLYPVDEVSCNSYDHMDRTWGQEYLDICLGTSFTDTSHTVELYCENEESGVGGWFCIAGYKVSEFSNKTGERDSYIMSQRGDANKEVLSFCNRIAEEDSSIIDISVVFNDFFIDLQGNPIGTMSMEYLWNNQALEIPFWPNIQGTEEPQTFSDTFEITASYEDLDGVIEKDWGEFVIPAVEHDVDAEYYHWGAWDWHQALLCQWSTSADAYIVAEFYGTWVQIFYGQIYSPSAGNLIIYIDDIYIETLDCYCPYSTWCRIDDYTATGLDNTHHTIKIVNGENGSYGLWHAIVWEEIRTYTEVVETITYNFPAIHVPPFAPENPRFLTYGAKNPTCDAVNLSLFDPNIPRDNAGVSGLWLEKRPATFAVCYQSGFEDILKTYDIVIVEPKALTRNTVRQYQEMGVKVICYQSYGEEVGTYENEWDITSPTVPYTGNGNGPGGYASYYNKGGNQFGECSECKHDRRRLEDVVECALEQTAYYAVWAGRCSNACTRDWRTGYETYQLGWNCGGGYNSSNNWSRTATKACTNSNCDMYNAVKGACPYYESPDEGMYGQDYSILTPDWPDENGIWKSFFTNPVDPTWNDRVKNHYLSVMFDESIEYTETVSVNTYQTDTPETTESGFKISNIPIDIDEDVTVRHIAEDFTYVRGQDYIFDSELGIFRVQVSSENAPAAPWGTELEVSYTRKGLQADGVFLDTLDTVDIYTSDAYKDAMVDMINEHHGLYPDKIWIMNRGFTILERLMPFTDFVMFESFITSYNWDTKTYYEITDPATIATVQVLIDQLFALREIYTFNVLGMNYCDNNDDALKQTIAEKVRALGWLSWNSTISLDSPQENEEIFTKNLYIESNAWRLTDELDLP